eukprot:scaffold6976_cov69-Phaeocystis_antarctica.AAC.1
MAPRRPQPRNPRDDLDAPPPHLALLARIGPHRKPCTIARENLAAGAVRFFHPRAHADLCARLRKWSRGCGGLGLVVRVLIHSLGRLDRHPRPAASTGRRPSVDTRRETPVYRLGLLRWSWLNVRLGGQAGGNGRCS